MNGADPAVVDDVVEADRDVTVEADRGITAERDRRTWRWIIVATTLGAAIRIMLLVGKWNQRLMLNDSLYYSSQARQNSQGRWFRDVLGGNPGAEHAPLTTVVLAPASLLPRHEFWQRATNTLIGIATIVLIARVAWIVAARVGVSGRRVAVVAAFAAAVYPNLWINDAVIMSETISTATVVVALWFALRHEQRGSWRSVLWCGVAVGVAALARSELMLLAPLFALIGARAAWGNRAAVQRVLAHGVVLVVAAVAVLVPWTVYNFGRFDAPVLVSTNAGGALLGSNCWDTFYGPSVGGWSVLCLVEQDRPGEDASERSQRWQEQAIDYVRDNKRRVPVVVAARLLRAADLYGLRDLVRFDVGEEKLRWASWSGIVSWWALAPLAAFGLLRQRRRVRWILLAPVLGVVVTTVLFYGGHRLRSPLEPVVVICAAAGLTHLAALRPVLDRLSHWAMR